MAHDYFIKKSRTQLTVSGGVFKPVNNKAAVKLGFSQSSEFFRIFWGKAFKE